jgi:hypothetical protein
MTGGEKIGLSGKRLRKIISLPLLRSDANAPRTKN